MPDSWFHFELTQPAWLAGLLVLPVLAYYFYRSLIDFPRWQQVVSLCGRAAIVLLIVLSLAGLTALRPTQEQFVVFAVDKSLSVSEESRYQADKYIDYALRNLGGNRAAFLSFAAEPGLVHTERGKETGKLDEQGTNLAAAIEAAAAAL